MPPKPSKPKLRSPILGAVEDDGYEKPQMSKLRGTSGARQEGSITGKKHLRSPLLGGDDDDDAYDADQESSRSSRGKAKNSSDSQESTAARKKRLRSPLLGEDDDDDNDEDFAPETGSKKHLHSPLLGDSGPSRGGGGARKGALRSPLLSGDDDFDEDEPPRSPKKGLRSPMLGGESGGSEHHAGGAGRPHKGGLHSPLLGGADDYDDDEPSPRRAPMGGATPGGKPKLRSSLLGGGGGYDDDIDDDWDDEDDDSPDTLRSPLLAAKKKRRPKEAPHAEAPHGGPGAQSYPGQSPAQQHQPAFPGQPAAPFPGPAEPQPPWQNTGAPPIPGAPQGWPGGGQPQPGQPWPPQGQSPVQPAPVVPPLPAGSAPGTPPWQNSMEGGTAAGAGLDRARSAEVPPIVDDNDEFALDISAPSLPQANFPTKELAPPPRPVPHDSPRSPEPPKRGRSDDSDEVDSSGPKDRRVRVERRKMPDRRFTSLIDEKGSSSGSQSFDDDDFSIGRPQGGASANAGMAKMMLGLGALAMGFKIYQFMEVSKMWDLSKLPMFVAEQFFSGLAIVGLIVLALSCMKK